MGYYYLLLYSPYLVSLPRITIETNSRDVKLGNSFLTVLQNALGRYAFATWLPKGIVRSILESRNRSPFPHSVPWIHHPLEPSQSQAIPSEFICPASRGVNRSIPSSFYGLSVFKLSMSGNRDQVLTTARICFTLSLQNLTLPRISSPLSSSILPAER